MDLYAPSEQIFETSAVCNESFYDLWDEVLPPEGLDRNCVTFELRQWHDISDKDTTSQELHNSDILVTTFRGKTEMSFGSAITMIEQQK